MVEIVGILIAAGNRQHTRAQYVGHAVCNQQRITRIGDQRREPPGEPEFSLTAASNITPPSEVMRPPSNAAVTFLRSTAGKLNGSRLSSSMAGVAVSDSVEIGFDTRISLQIRRLRYIGQQIPAMS